MTKKRRGFDIDLDTDETSQTESVLPETGPQRRGPMASAIHETAESLRDTAAVEAQIRAENDALAHEHVRLKKLGLITGLIDLDLIDAGKLTRDRAKGDDPELVELLMSVREIGLSNPIRIEQQPDGRYELVQGYRRLAAYRALLAETGDAGRYGRIPATIIARGDTIERLYRQMVDENLVRKDISFAEMAQMAIHYAAEPQVAEPDPANVVSTLFGSASYAKRSHIRRFVRVIEALGPHLLFAPELPRSLGLALAHLIEVQPGIVPMIRQALQDEGGGLAESEQYVLRRFADGPLPPRASGVRDSGPLDSGPLDSGPLDSGPLDSGSPNSGPPVTGAFRSDPSPDLPEPGPARGYNFGPDDTWPGAGVGAGARPDANARPSRISFQLEGPSGPVHCTAYNTADDGRIDLRLDCDMSRIDCARLQDAVQALLDRLD